MMNAQDFELAVIVFTMACGLCALLVLGVRCAVAIVVGAVLVVPIVLAIIHKAGGTVLPLP